VAPFKLISPTNTRARRDQGTCQVYNLLKHGRLYLVFFDYSINFSGLRPEPASEELSGEMEAVVPGPVNAHHRFHFALLSEYQP
jgi:hypothetical protein